MSHQTGPVRVSGRSRPGSHALRGGRIAIERAPRGARGTVGSVNPTDHTFAFVAPRARNLSRSLRALLLLTALSCVALGCSRTRKEGPKPVALTAATEGLSAQHAAATPVLERISCPPRSNCLTSRVYRDGTLYYLLEPADAAPPRWNRIARMSSDGVQKLEKLYASLCGKEDPVLGNDSGSDHHRVSVPGCTAEFVVTGIPAGELAPIQQVTEIINTSIIPGSGGGSQ